MTGMFGNRAADLMQGVTPHRPNHLLPLRMQGSGRNAADIHVQRVRRRLWGRALRDIDIWRRGCRIGLAAGLAQAGCDAAMVHAAGPLVVVKILATPALTLAAAVLSAAGTYVQANVNKAGYSVN